jgi:mannose-6-phosphate isomerase-like protein (cupin superfamily)
MCAPPVLVRRADAEVVGEEPNTTRLLVDTDHTDSTMNAVRTRLGAGVNGPPPHLHRTAPETFFLLEGELHVLVGDEVVDLRGGDVLHVPAGTVHAWATPTGSPAEMIIVKAPGTPRFDYFRLADRIRSGQAEPRELLATQERFDNHFTTSGVWERHLAAVFGDTAPTGLAPLPDPVSDGARGGRP